MNFITFPIYNIFLIRTLLLRKPDLFALEIQNQRQRQHQSPSFFDRFSISRFLRHQITKAFLSAPPEMATPMSPIDLLSIPPDIRNQITDLVLKPGHIHFPKADAKVKSSYPGFQLLAANHQTYSEGHLQFYSDNIFHLPAGLIRHTEQAFARYQPKHLALIRYVTTDCGLHDLADASLLSELVFQGNMRAGSPSILGLRPVFNYIEDSNELPSMWIDKLLFVLDHFPNIEELHVNFSDLQELFAKHGPEDKEGWTAEIVLEGQDIQDQIGDLTVDPKDFYPRRPDDFKLLGYGIALAAERAHSKMHDWRHEVRDWQGMLRKFEEVAELQERKLQSGEHKGPLYTPQMLRSLCSHGLGACACPVC